jgi:TonB family protein
MGLASRKISRFSACMTVAFAGLTSTAIAQQTQTSEPSQPQFIAQQAVSAVLARYKIDPSIPVPKTNKPLPVNGIWSIGKETPTACPKTADPCVQVFYRLPDSGISCEWIVLLRGRQSDNFILSENDDVGRYLMTKVLDGQFQIPSLSKEPPLYPLEARQNHIQGSVKMMVRVAATGHVEQVTVISGPEALRDSAVRAVRQWIYKPLIVDSTAIPFQTVAVSNYKLGN